MKKLNTPSINWQVSASTVQSNPGQGLTLDASGSTQITCRTNNLTRLTITDASSIFLNSLDLSGNNLVNVNNLTVSRASPQVDASFNFTIVRIASTTATRDTNIPSPYNGQLCFILNTNLLQYYNNGAWGNINQSLATATVSGFTLSSNYEIIYVGPSNNVVATPTTGGFTIYRFFPTSTTSGTFVPNFTSSVEYLVVGGGGGGGCGASGSYYGGGGGAGGYRTNYSGGGSPSLTLTNGVSYTVTVGQGGNYTNSANTRGTSGVNSVFATISSTGGGGGGGGGALAAAFSGGSGGGGTVNSTTGGAGNAGGYTPVEGYRGGNYNTGGQGAPGGGASGIGSDTLQTPTLGLSNSITGTAVIYGYGGGGNPGQTQFTTPGSGGKGGRDVGGENGANGIAGIVIVRFPSFV